MDELSRYDYAHRGLHNSKLSIPENSIKAFQFASNSGFGIELDVILTFDNVLVVHHDKDLSRSCKLNKNISDLTFKELQSYGIFETTELIPSFVDVLSVIDGSVPIIIEIKNYDKINLICQKFCEAIVNYNGDFCVQSFDPRIVRWFKKNRPDIVRGQLMGTVDPPNKIFQFFGQNLLTNFYTRPDFESYEFALRNNPSLQLAKSALHMQEVSWTIRTPEQYQVAKSRGAICIFEGFMPSVGKQEKNDLFFRKKAVASSVCSINNIKPDITLNKSNK